MSVELSITCWERTYRDVLAPGFVSRIAAMNLEPFAERVVVINNINDMADAIDRAQSLVAAGEISRFTIVADRLDEAMATTGLTRRRLGNLIHYTDHFLVAVSTPGPEFLCHWDSDSVLVEPCDWVTPTVGFLTGNSRVLLGMPAWEDPVSSAAERLEVEGRFDLGYGFTDHVFVVERARLARPVYRHVAAASWWYPTSHLAPIFEQRVDAYMRRSRLLRAVYQDATYVNRGDVVAAGGGWRRGRRKAQDLTRAALEKWWPNFNPALIRRPHARD